MSKKTTKPLLTYMFVIRDPVGRPNPSPEEMQQSFEKWMAWIATMRKKGQYLSGDPLEDTPARVLRGPRGARVTDGPFAEAKEIVAGYLLIRAQNLAEAARIAKDCPGFASRCSIEIRQVLPLPD